MLLRKNTSRMIHTVLPNCTSGSMWYVKLNGISNDCAYVLIQNDCQLREDMKMILTESDYSRTKVHQKNSYDAEMVGILTAFLLSVKYYAVHNYKNSHMNSEVGN